jgi:hypothetical protein
LLFTGLVLLFLLPFAWILTLVTLLAPLMAGLIALLLLAPVRLVPLVPKVLLLLVSLFFLGRVHYEYLRELESRAGISVAGCHCAVTVAKC